MKKSTLLLFAITFSCIQINTAQVAFQMRYDSQEDLYLPGILPYTSGYYLGGQNYDSLLYYRDIVIMRTNINGIQQWTKAYDSQLFDIINDWYIGTDGSIVMAGNIDTSQGIDGDALILKVDSNGNFLWATAIGGDEHDWATGVVGTRDGGTAAICNTYSFGTGHEQMYLVKLDSAGNKVWSQVIGDTILYHSYSLQETFDGGFVLTGEISPPYSMVLVKTDSLGIPQWRKDYDGTIEDWAFHVFQNSDSGYTVYGTTGDGDYPTIIKTNQTGDLVWSQKYMGPLSTLVNFRNFAVARDHGFLFSGYLLDSAFQQRFFLTKVDTLGQVLWTHVYDSTFNTYADSRFLELSDSSFIFPGYMSDTGNILMQTHGSLSCVIQAQTVFASSVNLVTDSGITWFTPADYVWHPVMTTRSVTVNTDTLCYNDLGTAIQEKPESVLLNVYPNPFNTQLHINSDKEIRQIIVTDNLGRIVFTFNPKSMQYIIDSRNWAEGVYYIKCVTENAFVTKSVYLIK